MEIVFWACFTSIVFAYVGYPIVLTFLASKSNQLSKDVDEGGQAKNYPSLTVLIPAHNEEGIIEPKLRNTLALTYSGELEVVVVSDGSVDNTEEILQKFETDPRVRAVCLRKRKGKANALNVGLRKAKGEIIVFSDASIILEKNALVEIVSPFANRCIGCVSGEDRIEGSSGEGLYGKYELFLRRQESKGGSIVGASGSFYAQRKDLISEFPAGVAPDFLSVLNTVKKGFRAVAAPEAIGYMAAVASSKNEFKRKTRTVIRGMACLFTNKSLLNPLRYPVFAFFLWSHKVIRWCVPFFLIGTLVANVFLLESRLYLVSFGLQLSFYLCALLAYLDVNFIARSLPGRIALYFSVSNLAILVAWMKYLSGVRQEIWTPSSRDA